MGFVQWVQKEFQVSSTLKGAMGLVRYTAQQCIAYRATPPYDAHYLPKEVLSCTDFLPPRAGFS